MPHFTIVECANPACRMRFPVPAHETVRTCVRCGGTLQVVAEGASGGDAADARAAQTLPLEVLVDNIRSAFNVGSILRSANGAGAQCVHLCGVTPTPEHPRVAKTALGADRHVAWRYATNALLAARMLQENGATLWALEGGATAVSLFAASLPDGLSGSTPLVLVAGNEVTGVDPAILDLCARVVCLPMRGSKLSLNVAVASGAALVLLAERIAAG